jgi:diketogulonate reductase-like aldo/keto reductase
MPPATGVESTSTIYSNIQKSLAKIDQVSKDGEKYIDLYLVHAPRSGPEARKNNWEALVKAQKEGWVKDIGVSNLYAYSAFDLDLD